MCKRKLASSKLCLIFKDYENTGDCVLLVHSIAKRTHLCDGRFACFDFSDNPSMKPCLCKRTLISTRGVSLCAWIVSAFFSASGAFCVCVSQSVSFSVPLCIPSGDIHGRVLSGQIIFRCRCVYRFRGGLLIVFALFSVGFLQDKVVTVLIYRYFVKMAFLRLVALSITACASVIFVSNCSTSATNCC